MSKIVLKWLVILNIGVLLSGGCLGKTAVRNIYYISPKKRSVFIAPPVNYSDQYLLDDQIRKALAEYFNARIRFSVVERAEDSDLYVLLHINDYVQKSVNDYGFGNTELKLNTTLFVSDSQYQDQGDNEQVGRYYFKNRTVNIDIIDTVDTKSVEDTAEKLKIKGVNRLAETIHSLMEIGKEPPR